jgi:sn-glycerol 3-phosphate transport system substrate-binding protein
MLHFKRFALVACALLALVVVPTFAQAPAEVKFWHIFQDENRLTWSQDVAAAFNEQFPQFNVTVEAFESYEELLDAATLALEQGTAPAIVQYFEVGTQVALDSGYYKSVGAALADRTEINGLEVNLDDFIAPVANYYTIDGQLNSMPWNSSSPILYANVPMLEAAGVEGIPTTWQEVEAACEAVLAMADAPEYCITWPNHGWFFEQWMAQQDAPFANNDNGRSARATEVLFNSEAGVAIATWWQDMYNKGYY